MSALSSPAGAYGLSLPGDAAEVLESVVRHRLMTAGQVHELHLAGKSLRTTQRVLTMLARAGLVSCVRPGRSEAIWLPPTLAPRRWTGEVPGRGSTPGQGQPRLRRGPAAAHTLAINDVGRAFVRAARQLGHECHPADWEHEVALRVERPARV